MSYILDALRKADAERERGSVPDLHAQLLPLGSPELEAEPARSPPLLWLGVGLLLAVGAGLAWWMLRDSEPAMPAPPVAAQVQPAPAAVALPAASVPAAMATASPVLPPTATPPAPRSEAVKPQPKAAASTRAAASAPVAKAAPPRPKVSVADKNASAPSVQSPPPPPPARVPALAELPADLRQQVPPLVIGGSVYSPQASVRMVIVNGQVFQEGSSLAPELRLEQIRPKSAIFSIRGQRFELPL
jgi:general secretion pathway protein B